MSSSRKQGVIAGGSEISVEAGARAFRAGGNAADAVVAAAFATSAGEPSITSLVGGGALIFREAASGQTTVCDFFANAPGLDGKRQGKGGDARVPELDFRDIEVDFGNTRQTFHIGRGSAAVPGTIPGLLAAWKRWGTLPLQVLLESTTQLLRESFPLSPFQSYCCRLLAEILAQSPLGRESYLDASGKPLAPGARFQNPRLAATLERLGESVDASLYLEEVGKSMVRQFGEERGGWLTSRDIESYSPVFRAPLVFSHGGGTIATNPSPSLGGPLIQRTLELFERVGITESSEASAGRFQRIAAVFRAIAEARALHVDLLERADLSEVLSGLLDSALAGADPSGADGPALPGNTVHISALDEDGNAAGVTLSHGEGSGDEIDGTGLLMNNFLGEEDLFPHGFHRFRPGQRLGTMMAPTIVEGPGDFLAVLGSGGSNRIRTAIAQVLSGVLDDGLPVEESVSRGRLHI
jgi:gamma-glutamyltranspeptidase/glutathione hydrolase